MAAKSLNVKVSGCQLSHVKSGRDKNPKQWPDPKHMKDDVEQMKDNFDFIEETQQF